MLYQSQFPGALAESATECSPYFANALSFPPAQTRNPNLWRWSSAAPKVALSLKIVGRKCLFYFFVLSIPTGCGQSPPVNSKFEAVGSPDARFGMSTKIPAPNFAIA